VKAVHARINALRAAAPRNDAKIPVDLATASGSGLDPHISPAAAEYQISRVAKARGSMVLPFARWSRSIRRSVARYIGEPVVNVLVLNLALDERR